MNDARWGERQMFIGLMRKHANNNKHVATGMAPKRPALAMFGGTLSIDEFRRGSSNVIVTMPWKHTLCLHLHTRPRCLPSRSLSNQRTTRLSSEETSHWREQKVA
jgi:hypothetical protein